MVDLSDGGGGTPSVVRELGSLCLVRNVRVVNVDKFSSFCSSYACASLRSVRAILLLPSSLASVRRPKQGISSIDPRFTVEHAPLAKALK